MLGGRSLYFARVIPVLKFTQEAGASTLLHKTEGIAFNKKRGQDRLSHNELMDPGASPLKAIGCRCTDGPGTRDTSKRRLDM